MSTMKDTQFSAKEDIYIASGLLSYGAKEGILEFQHIPNVYV